MINLHGSSSHRKAVDAGTGSGTNGAVHGRQMEGAAMLGSLLPWAAGAAVAAAAAPRYLVPRPGVYRPDAEKSPPCWNLGNHRDGGDSADGSEVLRVCQINVWSGSTYELEPEGASTAYQLFFGSFGSFEKDGQREARRAALVKELKALRPAVVTLNEAASSAWVRELADELGMCAVWHSGVAVVRLGPLALPPSIDEGDAILFHSDLECEHVARQRLSGLVWGERLAFNFGDATQALGVLLKTPVGRRLYVIGTHWQASLIEDEGCRQAVAALAQAQVQDAGTEAAQRWRRRDLVLAEGNRLIKEGTAMRVEESEGVLALLKSAAAQRADAAVVMGDLNTTPATPEILMLIERGGLVDGWTKVPTNPHVALQIAAASSLEAGVLHTGAPVLPWEAKEVAEGGDTAEVKSQLMHEMAARVQRLDYILPTDGPALSVEKSFVVMDGGGGGTVPSDHFGVVADLRLRSRI